MYRLLYFLLLLSFAVQGQTLMPTTQANILKEEVKERARSIQTLTSDFVQYKHLDFLSNDIVTKGKLSYKAPEMVKWEYKDPFHYTVLFKNETIYINDDGDKNQIDIGSNTMFRNLSDLIVNSISGSMFNEEEFEITYYKEESKRIVHFLPKQKQLAAYINAFHLTFNELGDVTEVKMIEPSGDFTRIVFTNKEINKKLSDEVFAD